VQGSVGNNISNIGLAIFLAIQYGQSGQYYCNIHQNSQYNIGISKSWQYNRALSNIVPHTGAGNVNGTILLALAKRMNWGVRWLP
jgi:hypothetical protein